MSARDRLTQHTELTGLDDLQAALVEEMRRYRVLYDSAPVAFATTDHDGKIVEANRVASELLEVENRFLLGKPILSFVETENRGEVRRWMIELSRRHARGTLQVRMHRRSGVPFDAELRVTPTATELAWAIVDKTDELRAEEDAWQLHRELELRVSALAGELQEVWDELPIGVIVVDAAAQAARSLNPRAAELLRGWDGRLTSLRRADASGAEIRHDLWPVSRALAGEHVSHEVVRMGAPGGADLLVDLSAVPLRDPNGDIDGAILTFDDLSARRRKEEADAQFVENAAHQLRTPITAIVSAAAALQSGAKDEPDARDRFLTHIERESERIGRLLEALLSLARLQRSGIRPALALVPLRPLLEELAAAGSPLDGVEVIVDCPLDLAIVADASLAREAIGNVLANAILHTPAGTVRVVARLAGSTACIDVEDSGPGIAEAERDRIFERFYRGPRDARAGAGLGLPIAAEAAHANRGTLSLLDTDGDGATFRFEFPGATILR